MTLTLPEQLVIARAADLRTQWLSWLDAEGAGDDAITLDGAATEKVDGTGVALLLSLLQELRARGRNWSWTQISSALEDATTDMGVARHLHSDN